jgi:hypothetical protein
VSIALRCFHRTPTSFKWRFIQSAEIAGVTLEDTLGCNKAAALLTEAPPRACPTPAPPPKKFVKKKSNYKNVSEPKGSFTGGS